MRVDGPTPAGGAYAETVMVDVDGKVTDDPNRYASGEVVEYTADGVVLRRTYLVADPTPARGPLVHDDALDAALDALWQRWDPAVATFDALWTGLGADRIPFPQAREKLAMLTVLPGWADAPQSLRDEVSAWLVATRPTA